MFGVSTFCLHKIPLQEALDRIVQVTDRVEIMDDGLHFLSSPDLLESYSVQVSLHAPCRSVNIASILEPIRKASVEVLDQCFTIAADLDAPVVLHPGYCTWREEYQRALAQNKKSMAELKRLAQERSVAMYVENMGNWDYFFLRYPSDLPLLDGCGLALDVGHAHLNNCLDEFLAAPIAHFHLHDNEGKADSHAPIGSGTIAFGPVMESVRRNRVVPIIEVETFEGVLASIEALSRK
ncbi:MAG: sugar phosphate isomerase/epimerase [Methanomicrobiales archaeon]|nr:sugar phosphate isomerase/epimerase [Methanomicrobiales archaeon]